MTIFGILYVQQIGPAIFFAHRVAGMAAEWREGIC